MASSFRIIKDDVAGAMKMIKALTKSKVLIGIPEANAEREPAPGESQAASNALIGYVQEFGSPEKNIPARPFLIPGVESIKDKAAARFKKIAQQAFDGAGTSAALENGLAAVGFLGQTAVQNKITEGPFAPLADATIEARARRGRAGAVQEMANRKAGLPPSTDLAKPLIDTGALRQAITYVVRDKGK